MSAHPPATAEVAIRPVEAADLDGVIALDAAITGIAKPDYWYELFHRYGTRGRQQRFFLVAVAEGAVVGYILGEVRDWEFGQPPCGWVFGIGVRPDGRLAGVGARLLAAILAGFRRAGVTKVRTLTSRENNLVLSFFRSQGMMAAPFIPLELDLA
ncbi:MAG: GNAT family N-acetyltransferase [Burkholderiales bacterium]|nr:GNAT family N-acetyltransferase [Burkholderiales bacterium]